MENRQYTESEVADIKQRQEKALNYLKENGLQPAAFLAMINTGNDLFGIRVQPYLQDIKFETKVEGAVPSTDPEVNPTLSDEPNKTA